MGMYCIQLAKASGLLVATTASPRNHELLKSLGADAVFDYKDPEVVAKIKQATGDTVTKAVDAISELDTQKVCAAALAPSGGTIILVQYPRDDATNRTDVKLQRTCLLDKMPRTSARRTVDAS